MTVATEETDLLEAARQGDADARERLLRPLYPSILSLARARLNSPEDAQDAAQEAFARIVRGLESYRSDAPFTHWALTVAANVVRDLLRRQRVRREIPPPPPEIKILDPADAVERSESLDRVMRAIERLDPAESAPLLMHLVHGVPQREIAQHFDISLHHLRVHIFRVIRKIRTAVMEDDV